MNLIGRYSNPGYASVADAVREFFERRVDLQGLAWPSGPRLRGNRRNRAPTSAWWRLIARNPNPLPFRN